KRMIMTFSELSEQGGEFGLVISKLLKEDMERRGASSPLIRALGKYNDVRVVEAWGGPLWKIFDGILMSFEIVKLALRYRTNFTPYLVLVNPICLLFLVFFKKIYFEVTSPDIAKSKSVCLAVLLYFKKITFVCVTEN